MVRFRTTPNTSEGRYFFCKTILFSFLPEPDHTSDNNPSACTSEPLPILTPMLSTSPPFLWLHQWHLWPWQSKGRADQETHHFIRALQSNPCSRWAHMRTGYLWNAKSEGSSYGDTKSPLLLTQPWKLCSTIWMHSQPAEALNRG